MKVFFYIIGLISFISPLVGQSQRISIPDPHLRDTLKTSPFVRGCVYGDLLDTNCSANYTSQFFWAHFNTLGIKDLDGIQYFKKITSLDVNDNKLTSLPILPKSLTYLYCEKNLLTSLSSPLPDSLSYLHCTNNRLTTLPTLPLKTISLRCDSNQLTFKDIVPLMYLYNFRYAPQDSIDNSMNLIYYSGDSLELTTSGTYTGNLYQWVKDGKIINNSPNIIGADSPNITLKNISATDAGFYSCNITNPAAPLLTINRRIIKLDIITPLPEIIIYELLSPNNDNDNDTWEIQNSEKYNNIEVAISNTWGNVVFHKHNYQNNWNGDNLLDGTYYYKVKVHDTNKTYNGRLVIKR